MVGKLEVAVDVEDMEASGEGGGLGGGYLGSEVAKEVGFSHAGASEKEEVWVDYFSGIPEDGSGVGGVFFR